MIINPNKTILSGDPVLDQRLQLLDAMEKVALTMRSLGPLPPCPPLFLESPVVEVSLLKDRLMVQTVLKARCGRCGKPGGGGTLIAIQHVVGADICELMRLGAYAHLVMGMGHHQGSEKCDVESREGPVEGLVVTD